MANSNIYEDMAARTGGDIYIGVVGPVRTGKSTFIKKFMESIVLPNIESTYDKERARDEMPQSAAGKTVMTTEPKFIPDEAVSITIGGGAKMKVRMVDCVGYIVPDALGHIENGGPRMVHTPWSSDPMPFERAAEVGTRKVITDHSTIGMVVTTDGTIGEIPRENYVASEERVIKELKQINKPFAIILNSADPSRKESIDLACKLEETYEAPVALVNCLQLNAEDIKHILEMILLEFPVCEIKIQTPSWLSALDDDHYLYKSVRESIMKCASSVGKAGDVKNAFTSLSDNEYIDSVTNLGIDLGCGKASLSVTLQNGLYYKVLGELTGFEIGNDEQLIELLRDLSATKRKYDKISDALDEVNRKGYGIVTPDISELRPEEPEIIKRAGAYGVRLKAIGPSIHMIKADIETEISPIVGTEKQAEDLVKTLSDGLATDPSKIWESNIFGTTLKELIGDGLRGKLDHIPDESRIKLSETLQRIINEGSGGLICIIL